MALTHRALAQKLAHLEGKVGKHDKDIQVIFKAIYELMNPQTVGAIGFQVE